MTLLFVSLCSLERLAKTATLVLRLVCPNHVRCLSQHPPLCQPPVSGAEGHLRVQACPSREGQRSPRHLCVTVKNQACAQTCLVSPPRPGRLGPSCVAPS